IQYLSQLRKLLQPAQLRALGRQLERSALVGARPLPDVRHARPRSIAGQELELGQEPAQRTHNQNEWRAQAKTADGAAACCPRPGRSGTAIPGDFLAEELPEALAVRKLANCLHLLRRVHYSLACETRYP